MIIKLGLRGIKVMLLPMRLWVSFGITPAPTYSYKANNIELGIH